MASTTTASMKRRLCQQLWKSSSLTMICLFFVVFVDQYWFGRSPSFFTTTVEAFQTTTETTSKPAARSPLVLISNAKFDDDDPGYKRGYQFGDISKGLMKRFGNSVNNLTGKEEYEFGDLTKWLDQKAKSDVSEFTAKEKYEFGDLSKEIIKRFQKGEYTKDDIILFLKIVAMIGIELQPIASLLPIRVLMQMLDVSIAQDVSGKVMGVISKEVDSRMKQFVTGDADYKVGDLTKKAITGSKGESGYQFGDLSKHAISKFTGKSNYEFGDITRKLLNDKQKTTPGSKDGSISSNDSSSNTNEYNDEVIIDILNDDKMRKDLDEWDKKYLLTQQQQQKDGGEGGGK